MHIKENAKYSLKTWGFVTRRLFNNHSGPGNIEAVWKMGVIPEVVDFLQGATSRQQVHNMRMLRSNNVCSFVTLIFSNW